MEWKTTFCVAAIAGMVLVTGCDNPKTEDEEETAEPERTEVKSTKQGSKDRKGSAAKDGPAPTSSGAKDGPVPKAFLGNYRQGPGTSLVIQPDQIQLWMIGIGQGFVMHVKSGAAEGANSYRFQDTTVATKEGIVACKGTMTLAGGKLTLALNEDVQACSLLSRTYEPVTPRPKGRK